MTAAWRIMCMCKCKCTCKCMCDLRKVTFFLVWDGFNPADDATPEENAETKERNGYFLGLVNDVDTSKDMPYIKTMALVEDLDDGSVHMVEPFNLTFKNK